MKNTKITIEIGKTIMRKKILLSWLLNKNLKNVMDPNKGKTQKSI